MSEVVGWSAWHRDGCGWNHWNEGHPGQSLLTQTWGNVCSSETGWVAHDGQWHGSDWVRTADKEEHAGTMRWEGMVAPQAREQLTFRSGMFGRTTQSLEVTAQSRFDDARLRSMPFGLESGGRRKVSRASRRSSTAGLERVAELRLAPSGAKPSWQRSKRK